MSKRRYLADLIRQAGERAIKQGERGWQGQRALSELLAEQMQTDPLGFVKTMSLFVDKSVIIDAGPNIVEALRAADARLVGASAGIEDGELVLEEQGDSLIEYKQPVCVEAPAAKRPGRKKHMRKSERRLEALEAERKSIAEDRALEPLPPIAGGLELREPGRKT